MGKEQDEKNRNELKEVIQRAKLDEDFKKRLLVFVEELENGRLEQLLNDIKQKLNRDCPN